MNQIDRRTFMTLSTLGIIGMSSPDSLSAKPTSSLMPTLFIGHGSPMNIIAHNAFTQHLHKLREVLPTPKKILVVSAHWTTRGVEIQSTPKPQTIYDFYGFPPALYMLKYPATGAPELAVNIQKNINPTSSKLNETSGYDHGTWSILHHLYPKADIPVLQLSLNENWSNLKEHLSLAAQLKRWRSEGVLIIGSGNIVHNLRMIDRSPQAQVTDWALEFDLAIKKAILARDISQLTMNGSLKLSDWSRAHPTLEHFLPLLYTIGATDSQEKISFPFEGFELGSLSMRSVLIG